jgi:hypothetical protein
VNSEKKRTHFSRSVKFFVFRQEKEGDPGTNIAVAIAPFTEI